MAKFFPGALYAVLAAIPGFAIGSIFAAPKMWTAPLPDMLASLVRGSLYFTLAYGVATVVYGGIVWLLLRSAGLLALLPLVVAGLVPVAVLLGWSLLTRGYDARCLSVFIAFGVPALFVSVALWWFTVASPARG